MRYHYSTKDINYEVEGEFGVGNKFIITETPLGIEKASAYDRKAYATKVIGILINIEFKEVLDLQMSEKFSGAVELKE